MRLMLLRHAKSEKAEPGTADRARRLNGRGRADAAMIGTYLARHELIPDLALVSGAVRTRETWERLAAALPSVPPASFDERLYDATADTIFEVARETARAVRFTFDTSAEQATSFAQQIAADAGEKLAEAGATLAATQQFSKVAQNTAPQTGTGGAFGSETGLTQQIALSLANLAQSQATIIELLQQRPAA